MQLPKLSMKYYTTSMESSKYLNKTHLLYPVKHRHGYEYGYRYGYGHVKFVKCRVQGHDYLEVHKKKKELTSNTIIIKCVLYNIIIIYFIHEYQGLSLYTK